jgi:hypothetical protein
MRAFALLFLLGFGCDDDMSGSPDMARLQAGAECDNGIGGSLGTCAPGLKCCIVPCSRGDGGCLDLPSQCEPDPPPAGYRCF